MRRGFTLVELMVTATMASAVVAAVMSMYLEMRVSTATAESALQLQRQASLVAEWVGRFARDAKSVAHQENGVEFVLHDGRLVRAVVQDRRLYVEQGDDRRAVARHVKSLRGRSVAAQPGRRAGFRFELELERHLVPGRKHAIRRRLFVGKRR